MKWLMLIAAISLTESIIISKGRSQQISNVPHNTVGAEIMACTKIMARSTSGDDFMHLKTSHIKSRVIL